jgi:eukaryotic translation initiation factor 2C
LFNNLQKVCSSNAALTNATGTNIVQKINVKLGGINNALDLDAVWQKFTNPDDLTLFLGVDVTHPGPGDDKSPSIGSIVGNVNAECTKWAASIKIQRHRREQMVYLTAAVRERLKDIYSKTNKKPNRIVVYRDGVSSGEFTKVLNEEMRNIREACQSLSADYKPKITYIVCQKRHHTRFFVQNEREGVGKAGNVPPGTVVDHVVVHPVEFDFFLCSHFGIQGTSRPTHYCVLHDDSNWTPDDLQMVSYRLCHLYQRCPRSVSLPAPVYFADLVCERARQHHRSFFGHLSDSSEATHRGGSHETESSEEELINSVTVTPFIKEMMYWV